jgi:hypothetical protein
LSLDLAHPTTPAPLPVQCKLLLSAQHRHFKRLPTLFHRFARPYYGVSHTCPLGLAHRLRPIHPFLSFTTQLHSPPSALSLGGPGVFARRSAQLLAHQVRHVLLMMQAARRPPLSASTSASECDARLKNLLLSIPFCFRVVTGRRRGHTDHLGEGRLGGSAHRTLRRRRWRARFCAQLSGPGRDRLSRVLHHFARAERKLSKPCLHRHRTYRLSNEG